MEINKIYCESNLETMARMPNDFVDLVITSPPYAEARSKTYGGIPADEYIDWFKPIAKEIYRILKPSGSFILNIGDNTIDGETHLYTFEIPIVLKRELGFKFIDPLIWAKTTCPPGRYKNRFKGSWEFCYHFSKNIDIKFNPHAVSQPAKQVSIERALRERDNAAQRSETGSGFTRGALSMRKLIEQNESGESDFKEIEALPSNVLHLSPETTNVEHSAPFPSKLPAFFIKAYTDEGDLVYDPFLGSGTTAEVCIRANRNFIGSEIWAENCAVAEKRILPFSAKKLF